MVKEKEYSSRDFEKFIKNISFNKPLHEVNDLDFISNKKEKDIYFIKEQFKKRRKDETVKLL